ncbi:MAG TPA: biotin-dependent carboxyltransferase family protein [Microvirga sp.]|jgi:allophanate hydrolase
MSRAVFRVEQVGPLTTIQDRGRPGSMRYGVPNSGPMDRASFAIAQAALGNPPEAAAIEVSLGGLALACLEGEVTFAQAGGGFRLEVDGAPREAWSVSRIRAGQRLVVKPGFWGSWTYLAFAGVIEAPRWLGSQATHALSGFGGGRLAVGQEVVIAEARLRPGHEGSLPLPVTARPRPTIRVVLGPQDRFFAPETVAAFLDQSYVLTTDYDRMGVRLKGPPLPIAVPLDMPSEALVRGSVQVPGHGDPIVLLADHQSTGGYPKIATLASVDQDGFVQLRPRQTIQFRAITPEAAVAALRTGRLTLEGYLGMLERRG